jgi:hypothetical protein
LTGPLGKKERRFIMKKLISMITLLCVLSFVGVGFAVELPIIGKATIKKGVMLPIVIQVTPAEIKVGSAAAFKDQTMYITHKMKADPDGSHRGGYMLDGQGFMHDCPVHGKEIMGPSMIVLPIEEVENGNVTVELF